MHGQISQQGNAEFLIWAIVNKLLHIEGMRTTVIRFSDEVGQGLAVADNVLTWTERF